MEEWVKLPKVFDSEPEARKFANVIQITESRLSSTRGGPQFEIETELVPVDEGWQVRWRKVFSGNSGGCGNCNSCKVESPSETQDKLTSAKSGKVIQFRRK